MPSEIQHTLSWFLFPTVICQFWWHSCIHWKPVSSTAGPQLLSCSQYHHEQLYLPSLFIFRVWLPRGRHIVHGGWCSVQCAGNIHRIQCPRMDVRLGKMASFNTICKTANTTILMYYGAWDFIHIFLYSIHSCCFCQTSGQGVPSMLLRRLPVTSVYWILSHACLALWHWVEWENSAGILCLLSQWSFMDKCLVSRRNSVSEL